LVRRSSAFVAAAHTSCCDAAPVESASDSATRAGLTLLNGFDLRCDGERVPLPMPSQRLVAFLALQHQPVLRSYVAGTLWIDASEANAGASLRSALWRLRRLGFDLVEGTNRHLRLEPSVAVDVQDAVRWAERMLEPDSEVSPADIRRAIAFGELLPDWYDDWLVLERERLRQIALHTLEHLCERLAREGRFGQALDVGIAALRCEPLRESAHRAVIDVHLHEGNVAEAVRHYRFYARLLRDRLGLAPSERLQERMRSFHARMTVR
jgi:DNA-binding SARP family transcriptional activator